MSRRHPAGPPVALVVGALVLLSSPAAVATSPTVAPAPVTPVPVTPVPVTPVPVAPVAPGGEQDAGLEVTSVLPAELLPGGRVVVRGVVDGGSTGLTGARVEVRRAGTRSSSVSSLERWTAPVDSRPGPNAGQGPFDDPADDARTELVVELGDVPAGETVPFAATLVADEVGLRETAGAAGAYGLQLLLRTSDDLAEPDDAADPSGAADPVDDDRGFLLWSPEVELEPTQLSTTLALEGPPPLPASGLPDAAELAALTAPGGRLDDLLRAAAVLDADWVVDPVLLAGLSLLAGGTDVPDALPADPSAGAPGGTTGPTTTGTTTGTTGPTTTGTAPGPTPGAGGPSTPTASADEATPSDGVGPPTAEVTGPTGTVTETGSDTGTGAEAGSEDPTVPLEVETAARWLAALAASRDGREVVLTDWADPDPARLRAADDVDDAWDVVRGARAAALSPEAVVRLLDGAPRRDVLVATEGRLSAHDLDTLAQGRRAVLLPEDLVPLADPFALTYTPDAVTEVDAGGRTYTAVLDDMSLTTDATSALEGSPLALTRVLARLATTTLQRPNDPRLLAVALPSDLDPAPGAADAFAEAVARSPWVETVPLSTALGTPPSEAEREPLPEGRETEVPGVQDLLDAVADGRQVAAAVATPADPVDAAVLDLRAAATLSSSAPRDAATVLAEQLREQTRATVDGVQVVPGSRVTLVAAEAALPVTVVNDLQEEVSLVLQVRSRSPRLQVPETRVPVTVEAGQRTVVDVPVVAVASGRVEVTSQLVTAQGREWGPPTTVAVTVATQAEGRVLTGVGIAVAVLFVLGAARAFARNRRGRELAGAGPVEP